MAQSAQKSALSTTKAKRARSKSKACKLTTPPSTSLFRLHSTEYYCCSAGQNVGVHCLMPLLRAGCCVAHVACLGNVVLLPLLFPSFLLPAFCWTVHRVHSRTSVTEILISVTKGISGYFYRGRQSAERNLLVPCVRALVCVCVYSCVCCSLINK